LASNTERRNYVSQTRLKTMISARIGLAASECFERAHAIRRWRDADLPDPL